MTDHPEPEDTCRPVEVDGETIRVRGAGAFTDQDRELAAEIVRAAKAKFEAEPVAVQFRAEIAEALRTVPGRWNIRGQADAVMAAFERHLDIGEAEAWCKICRRVWGGKGHRCESDAEQRLAKVRDLRDDLREVTGARWIADALDTVLDGVGEPTAAAGHDGPSVAECAANDRRWALEREGE